MVPEPVRPRVQAGLAAPAGDHLADPAGGHRPAVARAQPQLRPPRLRVPGTDAEVAVQGAGGVVPDRDDPFPAALARTLIVRFCRSTSLRPGVIRAAADPGDLPGPDPGGPEHRDHRGVAALRRTSGPRRSARCSPDPGHRKPGRACPGRGAASARSSGRGSLPRRPAI